MRFEKAKLEPPMPRSCAEKCRPRSEASFGVGTREFPMPCPKLSFVLIWPLPTKTGFFTEKQPPTPGSESAFPGRPRKSQ